jgi:hypothetical protein
VVSSFDVFSVKEGSLIDRRQRAILIDILREPDVQPVSRMGVLDSVY